MIGFLRPDCVRSSRLRSARIGVPRGGHGCAFRPARRRQHALGSKPHGPRARAASTPGMSIALAPWPPCTATRPGRVGVASVTCGPGLTQTMTALAIATQARVPLVVFAGESPVDAPFYNQQIEQAPLVTATGAHYIAGHSLARMTDYVRDAFFIARMERRPVVIGVPLDLQKEPLGRPFVIQAFDRLRSGGCEDASQSARRRAAVEAIAKSRGSWFWPAAAHSLRCPARVRTPRRCSAEGCWRRPCRRAACSITILSGSALPAAIPGQWARGCCRRRTWSSPWAQASAISRPTAAGCSAIRR